MMRLKKYIDFKVNENESKLDPQYITEDELAYSIQGIKDINDDITGVEVNFKLIKELEGVQKDTQYIMSFTGEKTTEELVYEFHDNVVPGTEGYVAYEINIVYDYISKDELDGESFILSDESDNIEASEAMKSEINRFIKRVRADYNVSLLDWYIENKCSISDKIRPIIVVYLYKPMLINITVEDFTKFYDITNYTVSNGKLYMDVLFTDLVPIFIKDDNQEEWLCKGYSEDDYCDYDTTASDIEYALNKEHEEKLFTYFATKYHGGDTEALKEEAGEDLESMIKYYSSDGDEIVQDIFDTYRNMYCTSVQDMHMGELETEFFRYIGRNYGLENPVKIAEGIEQTIDIKYRVKGKDGRFEDKWSKETVYSDKYRFEFDFDVLKYYDIEKGNSMSLWELWREANDPERVTLEPHYSDHGDVDYAEFNKEIASVFSE